MEVSGSEKLFMTQPFWKNIYYIKSIKYIHLELKKTGQVKRLLAKKSSLAQELCVSFPYVNWNVFIPYWFPFDQIFTVETKWVLSLDEIYELFFWLLYFCSKRKQKSSCGNRI